MSNKKVFLVSGGDLRQLYTAKKLAETNTVYAIGFDNCDIEKNSVNILKSTNEFTEKADYIILPIPASIDGIHINTPFGNVNIPITDIIPLVKENGMIFGGKINTSAMEILNKSGTETVDYSEREEFNVLNAVPTAEGALQIAMQEMPSVIYKSKILITGFGRISKALIKILSAMGAEVTVTARKYSDLTWAEIYGCSTVHTSELLHNIQYFDLIINTVPAVIFDEEILKKIRKDTLITDLASKPGGVDFNTAKNLGLKTIWALSLPGKTAPVTAGEIIACTVLNILKERGYPNE